MYFMLLIYIYVIRIRIYLLHRQVPNVFFLSQGAGHNDVELYNQYYERLKQFVSIELVN